MNNVIIIEKKTHSSKSVFLVFLGIILFITLYYPFMGQTLRYDFGRVFSYIFDVAGTACLYFGMIFLMLGILNFFGKRPLSGLGMILLGIMMLSFATYLLYPSTFGAGNSGIGKPASKGYH
jgi:choline-glycine betaine transporter